MNAARKCRRVLELRKGFTLVELLVVIGIIAVLISILLPTLASARRAAGGVKCLASLRELGNALAMYSGENKGWYPIGHHSVPAAWASDGVNQKRWPDFLAKYVHKVPYLGQYDKYRGNSVLWGCPLFQAEVYYNASDPNAKYRTGYGMQYYVKPLVTNPALLPAGQTHNLAYIDHLGSPVSVGQFYKQSEYTRPAERGLIMDSNFHVVAGSAAWSRSVGVVQPFVPSPLPSTGYLNVDGSRHLKPGASMKQIRSSKGINMLFADGHAVPVGPTEAWVATRGLTKDTTTP